MRGACTSGIPLHVHVHEVSVGRLADLWSMAMACLPAAAPFSAT